MLVCLPSACVLLSLTALSRLLRAALTAVCVCIVLLAMPVRSLNLALPLSPCCQCCCSLIVYAAACTAAAALPCSPVCLYSFCSADLTLSATTLMRSLSCLCCRSHSMLPACMASTFSCSLYCITPVLPRALCCAAALPCSLFAAALLAALCTLRLLPTWQLTFVEPN